MIYFMSFIFFPLLFSLLKMGYLALNKYKIYIEFKAKNEHMFHHLNQSLILR